MGDAQDSFAYRLGRDPLSPYPTQTSEIYPISAQPVHTFEYWSLALCEFQALANLVSGSFWHFNLIRLFLSKNSKNNNSDDSSFREKINFTSWLCTHIPVCDWNISIKQYLHPYNIYSCWYFLLCFFNLQKNFLLLMTNHSHLMMCCSSVNTDLRHDSTVQFSCMSTFSICKSHCSSNLNLELKWI